MNKNVVMILGLLIVLGGGYFLLSNQSNTPATDDAMMVEEEVVMEDEATAGDDTMTGDDAMMENVVEVALTGDDFAFSQEEIVVQEGDTVRITLTSTDMPHDWVVDELDARTEIAEAGETVTVEFVADTAGEYEYYCSVGNHREQGMVGTLIVE